MREAGSYASSSVTSRLWGTRQSGHLSRRAVRGRARFGSARPSRWAPPNQALQMYDKCQATSE